MNKASENDLEYSISDAAGVSIAYEGVLVAKVVFNGGDNGWGVHYNPNSPLTFIKQLAHKTKFNYGSVNQAIRFVKLSFNRGML